MPKRNRDVISELAHMLVGSSLTPGEGYDRLIDAAAGHDRVLLAVYSLLAAGSQLLLFTIDVSTWAGAMLVASAVLFIIGLGNTLLRIHSYDEMLLAAMLARTDDDDIEDGNGSPGEQLRTNALADGFQTAETHYLFFGLIAMGAATAIDHWQYFWRGLIVLGGVVVLFSLMSFVVRRMGAFVSHPPADVDDE